MADGQDHSEVTASVWTDSARAPLMQSVIELLSGRVRLLAAGGPPGAALERLTRSQECPSRSDLRQMTVEHHADYLLMGSMEGASLDDVDNALAGGASILAAEPVAADLQQWAVLTRKRRIGMAQQGQIVPVPGLLYTNGFQFESDPYTALPGHRTLWIESYGQEGQATLFARLLDAWQAVLAFSDVPQSIDAQIESTSGQPPRKLRNLHGCLTAHARMADGGAAVVLISDRAGQTNRRLNVLSNSGQLLVTETSHELTDNQGQTLEHGQKQPTTGAASWADLIADQWLRLIAEQHTSGSIPLTTDQGGPLSCCLACLLSARTGEPEDPQKLRQMQ